MNPWVKLGLLAVVGGGLSYAAEVLRPLWLAGFRSNRRTIIGDALGRENQPFGYVGIPQGTGYAPAHAPDDLGDGMTQTT